MKVSKTRNGVSLRHVLMGLGSGQIYSLDKRFSDPRAPVNRKPTQEEMEEGIIPYQAVVPVGFLLWSAPAGQPFQCLGQC